MDMFVFRVDLAAFFPHMNKASVPNHECLLLSTLPWPGLFFGIYKFKFYTKTEFLNFHVFLCDLENEQKSKKNISKKKELEKKQQKISKIIKNVKKTKEQ